MQMADDPVKNLQDLYKEEYVRKFEKEQSPLRISRLLCYIHLSENSRVADFGCGNGMLLDSIHDRIKDYSGVDFSEYFITAAKKRQQKNGISNAEFFCESIEAFCSRNRDKFDTGFVMDLAEYVPDKEWSGILSAIHYSLKPGCRLNLHTPNAEFFLEIMKKNNIIVHQFEEHVAVRDAVQNTRILEDAGFHTIGVKLLEHYNILRYVHFFFIFSLRRKIFQSPYHFNR
jgi:2-polyprenyl-6-hydroxyphenyl methylase / 3-demethylubiquinone-9 3-methyltransferase